MVILRDPHKQGQLRPTLGLFTASTLIVGSMIGSGIFRLPANMMFRVQDPFWLLMVWIVGGIFTIFGALTFAEMAGMFPRAGGQYQYLKESLGKPWAFLYGWTFFWVVQTGIIAAVAVVFAEFTQRLTGFSSLWIPAVAIGCIVFLTVVNYLGAKFGGIVQNVFTIAKVGGLLTLVVLGFLLGNPEHPTFDQQIAGAPSGGALFSAFFSAMLLGLFAMDGWPQATYVAPEIKNPTRNVPRAMIMGVCAVIVTYVLATAVYIYLVSAPDILAVGDGDPTTGDVGPIAATAAKAFAGETGAKLISVAVMISTFGTVNAFILTSPRIYYAVAEDRMFPARFRHIDPKTNVPTFALLVQGTWAGLLICLGRFSSDAYTALVEAVTFCIWVLYIPAVVGYFKLRRTMPDHPRPYKTHFYPVIPALFFVAGLLVVGNTLYVNISAVIGGGLTSKQVAELTGIWGTAFILTGLVVLLAWRIMRRRGMWTPLNDEAPPPDQADSGSKPPSKKERKNVSA